MGLINSASMLKGITVTLYTETESGVDIFNRPVTEETPVEVDNVIVGRPSEQEVLDTLNLTGRKLEYVLGIPKGDTNEWTDKRVRFFDQDFRTIGAPIQGIEAMIPLEWHKTVRCEVFNGEG